jgi:hypothetical protein
MIILGYIGPEKRGGLFSNLGWRTIRWAQRGYSEPARDVTHTEMMLGGTPGAAVIASSSMVDDNGDGLGGVRTKHLVALNVANWRVMYLPETERRNTDAAARWFLKHDGFPYDRRGAAGSVGQALVQQEPGEFFCSEACAASMGIPDPHMLCPAALWTLLPLIGGVDVTTLFFSEGFRPEWVAR